MLYQVLQLSPEQINALPPAERDAIQQLVGLLSPVIRVASLVWKADSSFVPLFTCVLSLPGFTEESVHGWRHHGLTSRPPSRVFQLLWLAVVSGFWVYESRLAMASLLPRLSSLVLSVSLIFCIIVVVLYALVWGDVQWAQAQHCLMLTLNN